MGSFPEKYNDEGRAGKHGEVRASRPRAKYFTFRPDLTQSISILSHDRCVF